MTDWERHSGDALPANPDIDVLRLDVVPFDDFGASSFEVQIRVNDVEMTSQGAGLGMDPYDVLVPTNKFVPRSEPTTFGVARCNCGVYGCGSTDVTVTINGRFVVWDWSIEKPMHRSARFDLIAYNAEVDRVGSDFSWETSDRTAGRLVLSTLTGRTEAAEAIAALGLKPSLVGPDWRDPSAMIICLQLAASHQVFLRFPWSPASPSDLTLQVERLVSTVPAPEWPAQWSAMDGSGTAPAIAGRSWNRWTP